MKVMALILFSMLLSACTSPVVTVCRDWPDKPERNERAVANYITDGWAAWKSCKLAAEGRT